MKEKDINIEGEEQKTDEMSVENSADEVTATTEEEKTVEEEKDPLA